MRLIGLLLLSMMQQATAENVAKFSTSRFTRMADGARLELVFDKEIGKSAKVSTQIIDQSIQIDLRSSNLAAERETRELSDEKVSMISVEQPSSDVIRSHVVYRKIVDAQSLMGQVQTSVQGDRLEVIIHDSGSAVVQSDPTVPPVALEDKALIQAAQSQSEEQKLNLPVPAADQKKAENEIPVLTKNEHKREAGTSTLVRFLMSLGIIIVTGSILVFVTLRWSKERNPIGSQVKIKMLYQHQLGHKRSLAIIRVAGETILLGITDQNISMIKTLSLIDEELPETLPADFREELIGDKESTREVREDDFEPDSFAFGDVKDRVTKKIRELRTL